jgi:hypothetical protein
MYFLVINLKQHNVLIKQMSFNFLEIGTSDFDYNSDITKKGILIEPVTEYFDRLVCGPNTIKLQSAITNNKTENECDIYYIASETITKYNLPSWMKGCNSINAYHPLHKNYKELVTIKKVKLLNVAEIFSLLNIQYIENIKIDTEGHDCTIMEGFYEFYKDLDKSFYPKKIQFESNENSSKDEVIKIVNKFKTLDYNATIGYDTILTLC